MTFKDLADVYCAVQSVRTVELLGVQIKNDMVNLGIGQVSAHPIPAVWALGASMHQCHSRWIARHMPRLAKRCVPVRWFAATDPAYAAVQV
jgi:hypothetical protein